MIALSIPAGNVVEHVIDDLLKAGLEPQDIVIDTGNSLWTDTIARETKYQGNCSFSVRLFQVVSKARVLAQH